MELNRRTFIKRAGAGLGALGLASWSGGEGGLIAASGLRRSRQAQGLPRSWRSMRKIDAHNHVWANLHQPNADWSHTERLIEAAQTLGIETLCCSRPITAGALADISLVREV